MTETELSICLWGTCRKIIICKLQVATLYPRTDTWSIQIQQLQQAFWARPPWRSVWSLFWFWTFWTVWTSKLLGSALEATDTLTHTVTVRHRSDSHAFYWFSVASSAKWCIKVINVNVFCCARTVLQSWGHHQTKASPRARRAPAASFVDSAMRQHKITSLGRSSDLFWPTTYFLYTMFLTSSAVP